MSAPRSTSFILFGLCLLVAACHKINIVKRTASDPAKQPRLDWNLKTTVEAYQKAGFTSRKWNDSAIRALAEFAYSRAGILQPNEPSGQIISTNAAAAVRAGCKDPMVNYLFIKYAMDQTNSKEAYVEAFSSMAKAMNNSSYPPVRKFYAAARTLDQIFYTYGTNSPNQPAETEIMPMLNDSLVATLADKTVPAQEAYEVAELTLSLMGGDKQFYEQTYHSVEKPLFENWPDDYTSWLLKGSAYIKMAWQARGSGYANTVTDAGWKLYGDRLTVAEDALNHAWKLNPKDPEIAIQMLSVMLGQGGGREGMELWFNRAMELNTDNYDACYKKLFYLEPKWHGSTEEMLKFGHECNHNPNWGGRIPLILVDAHKSIHRQYIDASEKDDYWKRPDVWADIQSAFDRYFILNPENTGWYHDYAWYAYHAEQWEKLNELIPKLGPVNYKFFGGEDEYNKMVQLAKENAGKSKKMENK